MGRSLCLTLLLKKKKKITSDLQFPCMLSGDSRVRVVDSMIKGLFTWRWGPQEGEVTRLGGVTRLSI